MNAQLFQRVKFVFLQACEQPEHERTEFLDRACNGDRELRFAVEDLLMNDEQPLDLMQSNHVRSRLGELASNLAADVRHSEAIVLPASIGRYRTLKILGEGGMGVVYLAEQDSPRRTVALKIIASGRSSRQVLKRFDHEAHVLGRLQHPGIAQIFEAGTFDTTLGIQPYFAMEYVEGPSLLDYVRQRELNVTACIDLFIKVCEGVEHAHQKGIIHRDLKPGNILVDSQSQVAQPKILDFGVARITDSDVQTTTMHTGTGQLVGTVAYMSPEQLSGDVNVLDTRSDVYALGVILYQMLTGQFPYRVDGTLRDAMDAVLSAEPSRPSSLSRRVDDELETMLLKCLSKEPARRYQSAGELAQDLRRYLAGQPIEAKRNSRGYVLRKYLKTHWAATAVAAGFVLVVGAALVVSLSLWQSTTKALAEKNVQHGVASSQAHKANAVNAFLNEMLRSANPATARQRDITVRETLDNASKQLASGQLRDQPDVEAAVRMTIGEAYMALGKLDLAEQHLQASLDIREDLYGHWHLDVANSLDMLGGLRSVQNEDAAAESLRGEAVAVYRALKAPDSEEFASALMNLAWSIMSQSRMTEAAAPAQESVAMYERVFGADSLKVAHASVNLAIIMHQPAQSVDLLKRALEIERQTLVPKHPQIPRTLSQLAIIQQFCADLEGTEQNLLEAVSLSREIYGSTHPEVFRLLMLLNFLYVSQQRYDSSLTLLQDNLANSAIAYGENSVAHAMFLSALGEAFHRSDDIEQAHTTFRQSLAILREIGQDHSANGAEVRNLLSITLLWSRELDEASRVANEVIAMNDSDLPASNWTRPQARSLLGEVLLTQKRYPEAEESLLAGYEGLIKSRVPQETLYRSIHRLAILYQRWNAADPNAGKSEAALKWRNLDAAARPAHVSE